jgi:hypothetical protein
MKNIYQHIIQATLICSLVIGSNAVQAGAEESNESTVAVVAAPTVAPTAAPVVAAPVKKEPCFTKYQEHKNKKNRPKKRELELNWNAAIGTGTYSENDESYSLSGMGAMLEINPGVNIITAPGLDVGVVVGFLILMSDGDFSVDYEGPPVYTHN